MAENTFRLSTDSDNSARLSPGERKGLFAWFERRLQWETYFREGFPVQYAPKVAFCLVLSLLYIGNTHHADRTNRAINRLQSEVEDLRADYTTRKADVMFASKQSEVARRVRELGLRESLQPPTKITIEDWKNY